MNIDQFDSIQGTQLMSRVFSDNLTLTRNCFECYSKIYDLPLVECERKIDRTFYEYVREKKYFVVIVLYNDSKQIFLLRNLSGKLAWVLPGGSIKQSGFESIIKAIFRIVNRISPNINLCEIEPIAKINNHFHYEKKEIIHKGIGFIARTTSDINSISEKESLKGMMVSLDSVVEIPDFSNQDVFNIARKIIKMRNIRQHKEETESITENINKYFFNKKIVSPIFHKISKYIGKYKIKDMKTRILNELENANTVLDASCGDDELIIQATDYCNLCAANDISWDQLLTLEKICFLKNSENINKMFITNHNILELPFRNKVFDVVICKNTLHHMKNVEEFEQLLNSIDKVGKKLIIIDIQDPIEEGVWGRIRHQYYKYILKDTGSNFFKKNDFKRIIENAFKNKKINFFEMPTVRANYMFTIIENKGGKKYTK